MVEIKSDNWKGKKIRDELHASLDEVISSLENVF